MCTAAGGGELLEELDLQPRKAGDIYRSTRRTWENKLRGNKGKQEREASPGT